MKEGFFDRMIRRIKSLPWQATHSAAFIAGVIVAVWLR